MILTKTKKRYPVPQHQEPAKSTAGLQHNGATH